MGQDQSRAQEGGNGAAGQSAGKTQPNGAVAPAAAATGVAGLHGSAVATVPLAGIEGFQVVRLLPYSPAHKAGLVPYFDIITSLDHILLESEGKPALQFFKNHVATHRDQPVCFTVYNLHIRAYRDVYCVPSDAWGGGGLLGCSIEWSRAEACPERCVHVVDVLEGSPAAHSGELRASRDYIIGMQTPQDSLISLIKDQKEFYTRLEGWHEEQRWSLERQQRFPNEAVEVPHILLFLVYNSENNTVKEVAVEMGTDPEAALGMSVATGLLHIIPSAATAGDAAAATSLPVMNKFVTLEANHPAVAVVAPLPPVVPTFPPAPSSEVLQPLQVDAEHQEVPSPPPPQPQALRSTATSESVTTAAAVPPHAPEPYAPVPESVNAQIPSQVAAEVPPQQQQHPQAAPPQAVEPPAASDYTVPPPEAHHAAPVAPVHEAEQQALPVAEELSQPVAAGATPSDRADTLLQKSQTNPFRLALASVDAYEHRQSQANSFAHTSAVPSRSLSLDPRATGQPQAVPPHPIAAPLPPTPPDQPETAIVVSPEAAASVAASAAASSAAPAVASAPGPSTAVPQTAAPAALQTPAIPAAPAAGSPTIAFSTSNMPPPLRFPLFPSSAAKRAQH